jgi:acetyl esterase/lipase
MKHSIVAATLFWALVCANAHADSWEPSPGHTQLPIWPHGAPHTLRLAGPAGVDTVLDPTMTVYAPSGRNTGATFVVFPGGGYQALAMGLEGTEACDWLNSKGITCVLLKYRVPGVGRYPKSGAYPNSSAALEDAQRTMGLVRMHAAEWHIDPHRIGVLGFSAGGHLVAAISTNYKRRLYTPVDAADKESCRPDFAVALYPGHMREHTNKEHQLNPGVPVTRNTPPTFLVQAEDDPVDDVKNSLVYYEALQAAGVPVEMHLYAHGGHAFGLRRTPFPITEWPLLVERWLATIGML